VSPSLLWLAALAEAQARLVNPEVSTKHSAVLRDRLLTEIAGLATHNAAIT
jgi:hypothetical protein